MLKKISMFLFTLAVVLMPVFALVPQANALNEDDLWGGQGQKEAVGTNMGYDSSSIEDPRIIAANVIKILLGFLGIIAVVLIIWGGFKWMTAGGNEEQTKEAAKIIKTSVIGLLIILAAWGIATFIVNALVTATK
ncbi:MAG: pilin [Patescibacteria group bacterium]|nr:pilin [Patescibacteria group bacterium]MDD4610725.1 pilin [Patescibacteria group bacterium]